MNEALKLDYIWYLLVYDFLYLDARSGKVCLSDWHGGEPY